VISPDPIAAFWAWWSTAKDQIADCCDGNGEFTDELVAQIADRVHAIGDVAWELQPGRVANHAFCLSPGGESADRVLTEMWRQRGPAADARWEYYPAKQAVPPEHVLRYENVSLPQAQLVVVFERDDDIEKIHGTYWHPGFAELPVDDRGAALFILLDQVLGEDDVERWLGGIDLAAGPSDDAVPIAALQAAVEQLEREATGQKWVIGTFDDEDGSKIFVAINRALKRIDHVLMQMHVVVELDIIEGDDVPKLQALDTELVTQLGGIAAYLGRETRPGSRLIHLYAADDGSARRIVEEFCARHADRQADATWTHDPAWTFARRF